MDLAFVIGCSRYADRDIPSLEFADRDAQLFSATLQDSCGLDAGDIHVLSDDRERLPTRSNVIDVITRASSASAGASFNKAYFFFSGHGYRDAETGQDYLVFQDSVAAALSMTSLTIDHLLQFLRKLNAAYTILFWDACRDDPSGRTLGPGLAAADVQLMCPDGMVSFCSCHPSKRSYEAASLRQGIFTAAVIEALSDTGRCRTVGELDRYLRRRLPEIARTAGKPSQEPWTRVEPIELQNVEIVSPAKRFTWLQKVQVGTEIRRQAVSPGLEVWPRDPLCAVDFGTSFSAIGLIQDNGTVSLVPDADGRTLIPTVVHFDADLNYTVGHDALRRAKSGSGRAVRGVKRQFVTGSSMVISEVTYAPETVASLILGSLKRNTEEYLGTAVRKVVVSMPANFTIPQTNSLLQAFQLAGFDVVRTIYEPSAASLLIGHPTEHGEPEGNTVALIVDLGGGTLDVAVVEAGEGVFEVGAVGGDNMLGGMDFDDIIADHIEAEVASRAARVTPYIREQIREEAEAVKSRLAHRAIVDVVIRDVEASTGELEDVRIVISEELFGQLTAPLLQRVRAVIERVLWDAHESVRTRIESVLGDADYRPPWVWPTVIFASGQGIKIPLVARLLRDVIPSARLVEQFRENAVILGLALQVGVLTGIKTDTLLLDTQHHALGLRCSRRMQFRGPPPPEGWNPFGDAEPWHRRHPPVAVVSQDSGRNGAIAWLVKPETTIPTSETVRIRALSGPTHKCTLSVVESKGDGSVAQIAAIDVETGGRRLDYTVTLDIDSNHTASISIEEKGASESTRVQLNNQHLKSELLRLTMPEEN